MRKNTTTYESEGKTPTPELLRRAKLKSLAKSYEWTSDDSVLVIGIACFCAALFLWAGR